MLHKFFLYILNIRTENKKNPLAYVWKTENKWIYTEIYYMELYDIKGFNASLAKKLYCADYLEFGLKIRNKEQALKHKYIQANDNYIKFLIVDCDHDDFFRYETVGLPAPNFAIKNKENGHFHYVWALADPIYKDYVNKAKNLAYFAKIQQEYTRLCKGDTNYINLITKNPNNAHWQTYNINCFYAYTLDELAESVELPDRITEKQAIGEGRNCYLFDTVRKFAYAEVKFYKEHQATYQDFYNLILNKLEKTNIFEKAPSLPFNELKAIAKSISKWTWQKFSAEKFSEIQAARGKKRKGKYTKEITKLARKAFEDEFTKQ